ncbi:MAG TPA: lasso peptide biosynthesis B2 protein [Gemmatimonadaceae bacterium]|nr:lasso peptide biosynthesis B2 protein [Gemmatimonadaceae bacterium]
MLDTIRRYRAALPKLLGVSLPELWDLLAAQTALAFAQARVWTRRRGRLVAASRGDSGQASSAPSRLDEAHRLALAITRASAFGFFRPACLVRSIALCRMMESRGVRGGLLQIGVRLQDGRLVAHAWVEYGGEILGDDPASVSRFDLLPELSLTDRDRMKFT